MHSSDKPVILQKFTSAEVAEQSRQYIDDRRMGRIKSLETKFTRLNSYLMGGIELDTILCISALSGAGKSTLAKCIRDSMWDLNKDMCFNQYMFNFEMLASAQMSRSIVTSANISLRKLYSVDEKLSDAEFKALTKYYDELKSREGVYFIETPGTAKQIKDS